MNKVLNSSSIFRSKKEVDIVDRDRINEKILLDKYLVEINDNDNYKQLIKIINKINKELGSYQIKSLDEYFVSEELKEKMLLNNLVGITKSENPCYYFIIGELNKFGLEFEPYLNIRSREKDGKLIMGYNEITYRVILSFNYIPKKIQVESNKYQITLFLANKILERLDMDPIGDLLYFKDILRDDILEQDDLLQIHEKDLFGRGKFIKKDVNYFGKNPSGKILNVFRAMVRSNGLRVIYDKVDVYKKIGGSNKLRKTSTMTYSIVE